MNENDGKGPGVKFPPPLVFVCGLMLGVLMQELLPLTLAWSGLLYAAGGLLVLAGLALVALSALQFRRARTHIEPWKPTSAIVSDGVFAYSRNPIYLGFCLVTIGLGCVFRNPWMILSCLPSAWVVFQIAIRREEAYLSAKFPQEYGTYRARVRRWL